MARILGHAIDRHAQTGASPMSQETVGAVGSSASVTRYDSQHTNGGVMTDERATGDYDRELLRERLAKLVLAGLQRRLPRLRHLWADQAYTGSILDWIKEQVGWSVEVVERSPRRGFVVTADSQFQRVALPKTFEPLPRRWGVERTLAWTSRYRCMSKDYERLPATSEVLVYLSGIRLLLGRLTRDQKRTFLYTLY